MLSFPKHKIIKSRFMMNFTGIVRYESTSKYESYILKTTHNNVTTLTMNRPKQLNGWTKPMVAELSRLLNECNNDIHTKAVILTGKGSYYCAGVNLSQLMAPDYPQKIWELLYNENIKLFEMFLVFKKPILIAVNGPAIGASVTSATLCDGIICTPNATFSTPFERLHVPPEGCSSVNFERVMRKDIADKMLNHNFIPNAIEAKEAGFVLEVVSPDKLMEEAQKLTEKWILEGKIRKVDPFLFEVNIKESKQLATQFLSKKFLFSQYKFLLSKKKYKLALLFWCLASSQPIWKFY